MNVEACVFSKHLQDDDFAALGRALRGIGVDAGGRTADRACPQVRQFIRFFEQVWEAAE